MKEELELIEKNKTPELVNFPRVNEPISVEWVYKAKANPKGDIVKHKAKLVPKELSQKERIEFEEVFTLVVRIETI